MYPSPFPSLAIVGAGAAGLMAAIAAARAARAAGRRLRIVALDGARHLGAKILIAGGGRCNVTHVAVTEADFNGSTPAAIRRVLAAFPVARTLAFFDELGVPLVPEATGKLFPQSNRARDVLDALLGEARRLDVELVHPWRVTGIVARAGAFSIEGPGAPLEASRVILATGGRSLPKSGSDGHGYEMVRSLGHVTTPDIFPALVPLALDPERTPLGHLQGVATRVALEVESPTGKRLVRHVGDLLCTHVGVSGPVVLDISRHVLAARRDEPDCGLVANWVPEHTPEEVDRALRELGATTVVGWLRRRMPERLATALCAAAAVPPATPGHRLARYERAALVRTVCHMTLPVTDSLGFAVAEVTAGGVPLQQLRLDSLESRCTPGLHLVGEICDVDGRIGGFNFQWAWASGHLAGTAAARAVL